MHGSEWEGMEATPFSTPNPTGGVKPMESLVVVIFTQSHCIQITGDGWGPIA